MNTQIINTQFSEAQRKHHKGDVVGALRIYEVILRGNPYLKSAKVFKLLALSQLGRGFEGISEANTLMQDIQILGLPEIIALSIYYKSISKYDEQLKILLAGEKIFPKTAVIKANLGNYYLQIHDVENAKKYYLSSLHINDDPAIFLNLARIEISHGNFSEAEDYLSKAENITPDLPDTHFLRAVLLNADCDYIEAAIFLRKVLEANIAHREAWSILMNLPEGVIAESDFDKLCKKVISTKLSDPAILFAAYYISRKSVYWHQLVELEKLLSLSLDGSPNFRADVGTVFTSLLLNLEPIKILNAAKQSWKHWIMAPEKYKKFTHSPNVNSDQKIRIGYLSSDLRDHVVARNLACVIERHSHGKFEVFAYSNFGSDGSIVRDRIGKGVNQWVNIAALDDLNLAKRIASDGIDVLVDLNGITKGTRVRVFEYRPAPIQITWNGMPGSLGSGDACDYIIVDKEIVDDVNRNGFDEHFIFMPNGCFPIDHKIQQDVTVVREQFDIPDQKFVYVTFCTVQKYHPLAVEAWAKIAQKAPESLILFLDHGDIVSEKIKNVFKDNNIEESRLLFMPALSHDSHLKRLSLVDCVLETWPYGAGGTCVDAIRVGTPIITLRGNHYPSRMGSSVSANSGLNFLVSDNVESYIDNALSIYNSSRKDGTKDLDIVEIIDRSNAFDINKFVSSIEKAYETAYQNYKNGLPVEDIYVNSNTCG